MESCIMTLAVGIVEEETGDPTVCTLVPGTDGTGGSCTVSGGGATPGTCAYQPAASATGTSASASSSSLASASAQQPQFLLRQYSACPCLIVRPCAVCCVLCAVQHGEVALFWTLVRSPLESI